MRPDAGGTTVALVVAVAICVAVAGGCAAAPAAPVRVASVAVAPATHIPPAAPGRHLRAVHCARTAAACVDTRLRLAWLQRDGRPSYGPVRIALGGPRHPTPRGRFRVAWKAPHWTSTEYGLPMPWSVFFAAGGIAFHAGPLDVASHGCVHLRPRSARYFFDHLAVGDVVVVR